MNGRTDILGGYTNNISTIGTSMTNAKMDKCNKHPTPVTTTKEESYFVATTI